jgi:hypothetical protein
MISQKEFIKKTMAYLKLTEIDFNDIDNTQSKTSRIMSRKIVVNLKAMKQTTYEGNTAFQEVELSSEELNKTVLYLRELFKETLLDEMIQEKLNNFSE